MVEEISRGAYLFEKWNDKIISVTYTNTKGESKKITLNQLVFSNGRIFEKRGKRGFVKEIYLPSTEGLTSNILGVSFNLSGGHVRMKFKDLEL